MNIPSNTNGPLTISLCTNCLLSSSSNCYIQIRLSSVITVIPTPKSTDHSTAKVIMHNIDDYAAQGISVHNRTSPLEVQTHKHLNSPVLFIQPPHIQFITESISQRTIADDLLYIATSLYHCSQRHFRLYTDGSLQPSITTSENIPILGAAWVIPGTDYHPEFSTKVATTNWPSSTRAELLAIWTGLLVMPPDAKIDLFTDSQAAIDGIKKSLTTSITPRFWLKANNDSIISNIKHRISTLHLTVKLHKIKGHSGNEYNDKADVLAKLVVREAKTDPTLILDINDIQLGLRFGPKWNGKYIDRSLRQFISIMTKNIITSNWILLKHNQMDHYRYLDPAN